MSAVSAVFREPRILAHVIGAVASIESDLPLNRVEARIVQLCSVAAPALLQATSALWTQLEALWTHEHDGRAVELSGGTARVRCVRLLQSCALRLGSPDLAVDDDLAPVLTWFLRLRPCHVDLSVLLPRAVAHDALRIVRSALREAARDLRTLLADLRLSGVHLLHLARSPAMVRLLLAHDVALARAVDAAGCSALHSWCLEAHTSEALQSSLDASTSLVGSNQLSPFDDDDLAQMVARMADALPSAAWRQLVDSTAVVDERQMTPLQICVQRRLTAAAVELSARGADALATSDDSLSALELAAAQLADDASVLTLWRALLQPHTTTLTERELALLARTPVGAGGFAVVSRVQLNGRDCALKELRLAELRAARAASYLIKSFVSEVTLQLRFSRLDAFVPLFGVCIEDSSMAIAMAFMANGALSDALYGPTARPIPHTVNSFGARLGRGVALLHARHVLHRDLTTRNILLDADFGPRIADFGISRFISDAGSATMTQIGNVRWAAPEITRSERYSSAADVYQLALVIFEILTRQVPFANESNTAAAIAAARGDRPVVADLPWAQLLARAWHHDARQRPSAEQLAADCEALPQTAVPPVASRLPVVVEVSY